MSVDESDPQTRALGASLRRISSDPLGSRSQEAISLRAPRLCRTIQTDGVVKRIIQLETLERNTTWHVQMIKKMAADIGLWPDAHNSAMRAVVRMPCCMMRMVICTIY